jgi:hypothetical protein
MKTSIPVNSFVAMMHRGELCYWRIVPIPQAHLDKFPPSDPQDKYGREYVDKKDIPAGAVILRAKWKANDEIVECAKR